MQWLVFGDEVKELVKNYGTLQKANFVKSK